MSLNRINMARLPSNRASRKKSKKAISKSKLCGLVFPVARIKRLLKASKLARCHRISVSAAAYLAAVLEYMTSELLDLAGSVTKSTNRKTIIPRSIMLAVTSDAEILKMMSHVTFPFSGVAPSIHDSLLPKSPARKPASIRRQPSRPKVVKRDQVQQPDKPKLLRKTVLPSGQTLEIVQANIAELAVDAVVNPTNANFYMGGMVGSSLITAGGTAFAQHMTVTARTSPPINTLEARVTDAPGLKAGHVIHVNGPTWDAGQANAKLSDLEQCIENVFLLAMRQGFTSIALPSIGSGRSRFPKAIAAETIVRKIKDILIRQSSDLKDIRFVLFDQDSIDFYAYELNRTT